MNKIIFLFCLVLTPITLLANTSRTFSCGIIYDGVGPEFPFVAIHNEASYAEAKEGFNHLLQGEDKQISLTGNLEIKNSQEFLKVQIKIKQNGLIIYNNNSQLGFQVDGKFNFVGIWLQELGEIEVNGKILIPKTASIQCQTYRN